MEDSSALSNRLLGGDIQSLDVAELEEDSSKSVQAIESIQNLLPLNHSGPLNISLVVNHKDSRKTNVNYNNVSSSNVNIVSSTPQSDDSSESEIDVVEAESKNALKNPIEELLIAQKDSDPGFQSLEKTSSALPVYPCLFRQRSTSNRILAIDIENKVHLNYPRNSYEIEFEDFFTDEYRSKFIALIGPPGCGKSTILKDLTNRFRKIRDIVCFSIRFADINYGTEPLTLRNLLLDNMYPILKPDACQKIFEWIVKNDRKCVLIFDAYNEAEWTIERIPPAQTYDKPLVVSDLIASLFKRHFLPKSTLIITTRPNSMMTLPNKQLVPRLFVYLKGFTRSATDAICCENLAKNTLQTIDDISPQLFSMCQNPKLLKIASEIVTILFSESDNLPEITRVCQALIKTLFSNFNSAFEEISLLSFQRFDTDIGVKELKKKNLCYIKTQDLIVAEYAQESAENLDAVKFCFLHKTIQAYFAALHIYKYMKYQDFKDFLESYLFRPTWKLVRRFLVGLFTNKTLQRNCLFIQSVFQPIFSHDEVKKKRNILITQMIEKIKLQCDVLNVLDEDMMEVSGEIIKKKRHFLDLCGDIREYNCAKLSSLVANCFPKRLVLTSVVLSSSDCHSLASVLKEVNRVIEVINFTGCKLNDHSFSHICSAILHMPGSVDQIKITHNYFSSEIVQLIIKVLPKVKRINMQMCVDTNNHGRQANRNLNEEEQIILQNELDQLKQEDSSCETILVDNEKVVILKKRDEVRSRI